MADQSQGHLAVVAPVFRVRDVICARDYYVESLLFTSQFEWSDADGEPPRYIIVQSGDTEVHLSQSDDVPTSIAYVFVNGVQEYYQAVTAARAKVTEEIKDFPWDMREFEVEDLDGNKLIFGEHLSRLKDTGRK